VVLTSCDKPPALMISGVTMVGYPALWGKKDSCDPLHQKLQVWSEK